MSHEDGAYITGKIVASSLLGSVLRRSASRKEASDCSAHAFRNLRSSMILLQAESDGERRALYRHFADLSVGTVRLARLVFTASAAAPARRRYQSEGSLHPSASSDTN